MSGTPVPLSMVEVDFNTLLFDLATELQARYTWNDLIVSGTGTTILDFIATIGTYNQFDIEMAYREAFLSTAIRDSSIYGIARMLGIQIQRKTMSVLNATVTYTGFTSPLQVLTNSTFTASNGLFFNPAPITILPNQTQTITLNEGILTQVVFPASSTPYFEYILGEPGFTIADGSITVIVQDNVTLVNTIWSPTLESIWMLGPTDRNYIETTLENGDVSILFGDNTYGAMPSINTTIVVQYVSTVGNNGGVSFINASVTYSGDKNLVGSITDYYGSGIDEKPSSYYKLYGSAMAKAKGRCVSKTDYIAVILNYIDVAGVSVQAQRDLFPNNPMWMNVIRVCILSSGSADTFGGSNPNPTSAKWAQFKTWLAPKQGAQIVIQTWNPTRVAIDINVDIALLQSADPGATNTAITANINTLFKKDMFSLGATVFLSDIAKACNITGVDYININAPTTTYIPPDVYTFAGLGNLTLNVFYSNRVGLPTYTA